MNTPSLAACLWALCFALGQPACVKQDITPLIGEDPEVHELLGERPGDPGNSALAAARRLNQAISQRDADMVWALLSQKTRRSLDETAATQNATGKELISRSALPREGSSGEVTWEPISWTALLFGGQIEGLEDIGSGVVRARLNTGVDQDLTFVLEEDGWKLELNRIPIAR